MGHKHDNVSMHSASTKHGPVHPRDVGDVDERMSHDLGERCTSAPHAQHEGAQLEHKPQGHAHIDDKLHKYTVPTVRAHSRAPR